MRRINRRGFVKGDVLTRAHLREVVEHLCSLPLERRREVPGINPERADIIIPGAAILETLMESLGIERIVALDECGLREGLLLDDLARRVEPPDSSKARGVEPAAHLGHLQLEARRCRCGRHGVAS